MARHAVAWGPPDCPGSPEPRDPYGALREAVAREGAQPRSDGPELRRALCECAALARHRMQPPEQYVVQIKTCVREAGGAIDVRLAEAFMARVVTLSIAEYYRNE